MLIQIYPAKRKGFTIMEMIVTCALLAIIAVIAVPLYSKYRLRAKVASMVAAASAAEFAVASDYFNQGYSFDKTNWASKSQPFLVPPSSVISKIEVEKGWVRVYGNSAELGGRTINFVFQPTVI